MFDHKAAEMAVQKLSKRYRVQVHWSAPDGPEAHVGTRQIWTPPILTPFDYVSALHELGHIVDGTAKRAQLILVCEAAAWGWALEHADPLILPRLSKKLRKQIRNAWATYLGEEVP